ncbi:MAG: aminoglycoside adenylyltransferase domain-containing protein [Chloroflexota bacterium]
MTPNQFTHHPEVNTVLDALLPEVKSILGDQFIGMYLHGSLAYGDFDPRTSDIDFLVVTQDSLSAEIFSALKEMHAHLFASGGTWSRKLEGAYLPEGHLRRHEPGHAPIPWLGSDGHFAWERLGSDWIIQRWILREKGVIVAGPPLVDMIDSVSAADLREAVRGSLREWWSPPFPSPERFQRDGYRVYAVLTMCRSLYVREFGRVASKPEAARWAIQMFDGRWDDLISSAATWRPGIALDNVAEMHQFIQFTLEKWDLPSLRD